MDENIRKLLEERDALQDRLEQVNAAIDSYHRWTKDVAILLGDDKREGVDVSRATEGPQTPIEEFEQTVRDLFRRVSTPLNRTQVYEELTAQGVVIGGKEPLNTVASRLSRMKGIINLRGHGYWAEERSYPKAGHPETATPSRLPFEDQEEHPADGSSSTEGETADLSQGDRDGQSQHDPKAE